MSYDINHNWGNDLSTSHTGDLALASGVIKGQQRVIRRLMTNPLDYISSPTYGAGAGRFVGMPAMPERMQALFQQQMSIEQSVSQTTPPIVNITADNMGDVYADIQYVDAESSLTVQANLPIGD